jgi:hypothetical protein
MERRGRRCLICQEPLKKKDATYCNFACQKEAHRRRKAYFLRYGYLTRAQKEALVWRLHRPWEVGIGVQE